LHTAMNVGLRTRNHKNDREELSRIAVGIMMVRGLEPEFSFQVREQLNQINEPAIENDPSIVDLRSLPWCSIDNDDSKDLDQLTVTKKANRGGWNLLVAIADVDALVGKDSPIDEHALMNTRSVYTSARVFPMLPLKLSNNLSSLNPGEDRLAMVCEMHFSEEGVLEKSFIYRALVHNRAQLAYDAVSDWLEGKGELPAPAKIVAGMDAQLRKQDALAQVLRVRRHEHGSLEFDIFQPRASFDGEAITEIKQQPHNRARQLIEEFMIATNGCTSRFLGDAGIYSIRRVVRSPERWLRIVALALEHDYVLPDQPNAQALEKFLAKQHREDPVRFPDLSLQIVKLMGSGEYIAEKPSNEPIGHFGLAVSDYMHSTAPNRRYPDIITLRLIKSVLAGKPPPYSVQELKYLAQHCTLQEDAARKVERQLRKSEAALLLKPRIGQSFDGVVSGVNDKGTWVRIFDPPVEGKLVHSLEDFPLGTLLCVKLIYTHVPLGFIDFSPV
jgi:exoribonuclease-2